MEFAPLGPYDQFGDRLIERGYAAIPIIPGSKKPGIYVAGLWVGLPNWQKRFNNGLPSPNERWRWGKGNAGIGVVGGYRGLIAVDIDTDNAILRDAVMSVLPLSPVRKSGQKGETLFYYGPGIQSSKSWDIDRRRVVDLIGPGRQTVLPPTIHPDTGLPYRWCGLEALDDLAPEDLPELPADIAERITAVLKPLGYRPEPTHNAGNGCDGDKPHRQLNNAAMANLAAWVPALNLYKCGHARGGYEAVATWRPSMTGQPVEKRKLNLKINPQGIRDFGTDKGYTPLDLVMAADGCDLDTAFRFLSERLNWGTTDIDLSGLTPPVEKGAQVSQPVLEPELKPEPVSKPKAEPKQEAPAPASDDLERFTHVPGLVGDIVDWITATARRPNRVLALGAAVTIVGTLIGRRVAGPTRSATHLYVVQSAGSGFGKQHILDSAMRLMTAAKAETHIGPSKFFSLSAVQRFLQSKPLSLCPQDEIGVFLESVTNRKASSHEKAVSQILRSLWGVSFSTVQTAQRATEAMSLINCPAMSILGMSTPTEFHAAMQGENVSNGFLNRFLVLACRKRAADVDPQTDPFIVPERLGDALHQIYLWSGPESLLQINEPTAAFVPDMLPWASKPASDAYLDLTRTVEQYSDDNLGKVDYFARTAETAIRLATIRAAGRWGRGAKVDLSDIEWGAGIAWTSGHALAAANRDFVPKTDRGNWAERIITFIRDKAGTPKFASGVKPRDIQQHLKGAIKTLEIRDILQQAIDAGEIEKVPNDYYRPL
jgi:Bifunctional DNA primase/polymerase, N-terminal/Protein of unknown function (DUF3987)